jgi:hypothetical protein
VSPTRYRIVFLLLGIALALIVIFAVVFSPGGGEFELPAAVQSISPGNNETVLRQIDLTIDMAIGYDIELFVDGARIPNSEIAFTEATGVHIWKPGASSTRTEWSAGFHSVHINYERATGRIDVGSVSWVFRVQ